MDSNDLTTGWDNEDTELPEGFFEGLPKPLYWRVLVMPIKPTTKTKGGIYIPMEAQDAQKYLNYMGKVVAFGQLAGRNRRLSGAPDDYHVADGFPEVGDYVVYGRYSGQPMTYKGIKLITINDDEILCTVKDPEALTIHI